MHTCKPPQCVVVVWTCRGWVLGDLQVAPFGRYPARNFTTHAQPIPWDRVTIPQMVLSTKTAK